MYLGSKFTRDKKHINIFIAKHFTDRKYKIDIEPRALAGNQVNGALYNFISSQQISKYLNIKYLRLYLHRGVSVPILKYGSECRVWQKHKSKVNTVELRSLKNMIRVDSYR